MHTERAKPYLLNCVLPSWDGWAPLLKRSYEGSLSRFDRDAIALFLLVLYAGAMPFTFAIDPVEIAFGGDGIFVESARYTSMPIAMAAAWCIYGFRNSPVFLRSRVAFVLGVGLVGVMSVPLTAGYVQAVNAFVGNADRAQLEGLVVAKDSIKRWFGGVDYTVTVIDARTRQRAEWFVAHDGYVRARLGDVYREMVWRGSLGILYRKNVG